MGLEKQALHLAASVLLLALNLLKGELEGAGGCQPGLKQSELDSDGDGLRRSGGCDCHIPTEDLQCFSASWPSREVRWNSGGFPALVIWSHAGKRPALRRS